MKIIKKRKTFGSTAKLIKTHRCAVLVTLTVHYYQCKREIITKTYINRVLISHCEAFHLFLPNIKGNIHLIQ